MKPVDKRLSRVQLAQFADEARKRGLDPADFILAEVHQKGYPNEYTQSRVTHKPTDAWFLFRLGYELSEWWPDQLKGGEARGPATNWAEQLNHAKAWLDVVRNEHETPDFWGAASGQRAFIVDEPSGKFTKEERTQIKRALPELGQFIAQSAAPATADDVARIETRIEHLVGAVDRLDRLDFKNALLGTLVSIAVELGLKTESARGIWAFATSQFAAILGNLRALGQ